MGRLGFSATPNGCSFLHDGRSLIRLDPATGSKRWSSLLGSEDLSERPGFDGAMTKSGSTVSILRTSSGARGTPPRPTLGRWRAAMVVPLTGPEDAVWSIALTQRCVIAYPNSSRLSAGGDNENTPVILENMPVILRRRETGALVQRFVFPTTIADVMLKVDSRGALLATSRGMWSLGSKEANQSHRSERTR